MLGARIETSQVLVWFRLVAVSLICRTAEVNIILVAYRSVFYWWWAAAAFVVVPQ